MNNESTRLNKFLAAATGMSRREADDLIAAGRVQINGQSAAMGARVSATDVVVLDDTLIAHPADRTYIAFNKPVGYVCSRRQQGDNPTIYSILPEKYRNLKPVGRLDRDSSGLLLLTDDGDFAHQLTHPSFHKTKTYEIQLDHNLEPLHHQMISDYGVQLEDGPSKLQLDRLVDSDDTQWRVSMHEGRNRQIRRTFTALGYTVTRLHRTTFGNYTLDNLQPGKIALIKNRSL
jgi:23S rRNA pseudouridine2605 synthase